MSGAVACDLISIGEVLWDLFPDGKKLGGATFNLAFHARQLGVDAGAVSRVGADGPGEEILAAAARADWLALGELMNINQGLMDALGVNNAALATLGG